MEIYLMGVYTFIHQSINFFMFIWNLQIRISSELNKTEQIYHTSFDKGQINTNVKCFDIL